MLIYWPNIYWTTSELTPVACRLTFRTYRFCRGIAGFVSFIIVANNVVLCCCSFDSETHPSNMVSPEESVDGNTATMDHHTNVPYQATAGAYVNQHQMTSSMQVPAGMMYNTNSLPMQQQSQQLPQAQNLGGMMYYPVPGTDVTAASLAKRRRLEDVVTTNQNPVNMLNQGQQDPKNIAVPAERRRERNKILARRTRLRKKFFFESLQKEVIDLQRENDMLKDIVRMDIGGDTAREILESCDAVQRMPQGVLEACREGGLDFDSQDFSLVKSIEASQQSFIITDPSLTDNPIVFASDGFLEVTGYAREQVLGRNCRFLQGTDTSKDTVDEIRHNLSIGEDVSVTILNYTADGTPFWNKQFIAALRDAQNNIVNYIGVVVKVASPEPGHPEFGKVIVNGTLKTATSTNTTSNSDNENAHYNTQTSYDDNDDTAIHEQYDTAEDALLALEDSVSAAVAAANNNDNFS